MSIFGTGVQHETFPTWNGKGHSKLWIKGRLNNGDIDYETGYDDTIIASIGMRSFAEAGDDPTAGLNRQQVKDAIEVLQKALDDAGPEPIVEPEGISYLVDCSGDYWVRHEDGTYNCGSTLEIAKERAAIEVTTVEFSDIVAVWSPVTPFREITTTTAIELPQVAA